MSVWSSALRHPLLFLRAVRQSRERKRLGLPIAGIALVLGASAATLATMPTTRKSDFKEVLHGVTIADPYRWLEDQESPETRAWITGQMAYTKGVLGEYKGRAAIVKRLSELDRIDRSTVPMERGGMYFYRRREADAEQFRVVMREGAAGKEQVLIDPLAMGLSANSSASIFDLSLDGKFLAYGIRSGGEDETMIRILQVQTRELLKDSLPKRRYGSVTIKPDKSGLYYSINGDDTPRIYEHNFGQPASADKEIFGKGYGAGELLYASLSGDGRWLMVLVYHGSSATQTDIYVQDLRNGGPIRPVFDRKPGTEETRDRRNVSEFR